MCGAGNDGTLALSRALDLDPTVLIFPFVVGPADRPIAARYGPTPLPQLEAIVRGIPLVVPAGDDGAYGFKEDGIERPRVTWPCVSPYVICAGGTQLGDRDGVADEGPWNDLAHAGGGGISLEPRPTWQDAPGDFLFSTAYVHNRIVPDVSGDAVGTSARVLARLRIGRRRRHQRERVDRRRRARRDQQPRSHRRTGC